MKRDYTPAEVETAFLQIKTLDPDQLIGLLAVLTQEKGKPATVEYNRRKLVQTLALQLAARVMAADWIEAFGPPPPPAQEQPK